MAKLHKQASARTLKPTGGYDVRTHTLCGKTVSILDATNDLVANAEKDICKKCAAADMDYQRYVRGVSG